MDTKVWPRLLPWVLLSLYFRPLYSSQLNFPENIETFFPVNTLPVKDPSASTPSSNTHTTSDNTVAEAVGITAASTLLLAGIFFFFLQKYAGAGHLSRLEKTTSQEQVVVPSDEFKRIDGALKGLIVDENGSDVLYLRKLGGEHQNDSFSKDVLHEQNRGEGEEEEEELEEDRNYDGDRRRKSGPIQEVPLLSGIFPLEEDPYGVNVTAPPPPHGIALEGAAKAEKPLSSNPLPPLSAAPPPPPPVPAKTSPPPPIPAKKGGPPAPPAPLRARLSTPAKPPPPNPKNSRSGQTKLKPLHWDKVTTNVDRSMVWHEINNGSFRLILQSHP